MIHAPELASPVRQERAADAEAELNLTAYDAQRVAQQPTALLRPDEAQCALVQAPPDAHVGVVDGEGGDPHDRALARQLAARHVAERLRAGQSLDALHVVADRAHRVADTNRNLVVFPNLVINDGSAITVRTFWPVAADRMRVTAWALGPKEETASSRARRLDSFLTFYGPGGLATPDDVEALEMVQKGLSTWREVPWSEISRGMNKPGDQLNTDEEHLRAFWRRWNELMTEIDE